MIVKIKNSVADSDVNIFVGDLNRQSRVASYNSADAAWPVYIYPIEDIYADSIYIVYTGAGALDDHIHASIFGEV